MTAAEIATRLISQPITALRVQKLLKLCQRMRVDLQQVLPHLTPRQRAKVQEFL